MTNLTTTLDLILREDFSNKIKKLKEDVIKTFSDELNWNNSEEKALSEDFIREFSDKVDCNEISNYKKIN